MAVNLDTIPDSMFLVSDATFVNAAVFAAGAVLPAAVSALIITAKHRRKEK